MNYFNSLADLPAGSRVFVFGAGVAGEVLLAFLAASPGVAVGGVIDNRRTGSFQGFPIRDWSGFLAQAGPDCVVLIASSKAAEIRAGLEGFPGERIYDAYLLACHLDLQRTVAIHELARQRDAAWNELHLRQVRAYLEVERWRVKALQRECFGEPEACPVPAGEIPPELLERFSMGGLARVYADYDNATYPANYPLIYRPEEVDACLARIRRGESYYYDQTDLWLQEAMDRFPAGGREVAVVGSRSPWFEAVCLAHGGRPVTIEFNPIRVADPRLRAMTSAEWERDRPRFSQAVCISSLEHSGLGRYGDPLDPDGDLRAMEWLREVVLPGGILFLSVPIGADEVAFNDHRRYGPNRLPRLLDGWVRLGTVGWDGHFGGTPWSEPVFILKNP